jgi:hypothetical protein
MVNRFKNEGLTVKDYIKAALKTPTLFYRAPASISRNILEVADKFKNEGLTPKIYLKAALKYPALFICTPELTEEHINIIFSLFDDGIIGSAGSKSELLLSILEKCPSVLIFSSDNLNLRRDYAYILQKTPSMKVLRKAKHKVEKEIINVLTSDDPNINTPIPPEKRMDVLKNLIQQGKIKKEAVDFLNIG